MRVDSRSPNDTRLSLARAVRSCMMLMPMSSCCSSLSSFSTSPRTPASTPSSSHVVMCRSRIARSGARVGICSVVQVSARSPHSSSRLVVWGVRGGG